MKTETMGVLPWRGLQPYDEEHADKFFGRRDDVTKLGRRILSEQLVVLTGPSGVGKTSVLRAGLVPALRALHEQTDPPVGFSKVGLTLVLRDWRIGAWTIDEILSDAFVRAADLLNDKDRPYSASRAAAFKSLSESGALEQGGVRFLERIRRAEEGSHDEGGQDLILVFDQLEEILRLGKGPTRERNVQELVDQLAALVQDHPRCKLLISLREEFLTELRRLENVFGGVLGRTYWLAPMPRSSLADIILGPARFEKLKVAPEIVPLVEGIMDRAIYPEGDHEPLPQDPVDLLVLQALLKLIWDAHQRAGSANPSVARAPLDGKLLRDAVGGRDGASLVGFSLTSAMLGSLSLGQAADRGAADPGAAEDETHQDLLSGIVARIAPFLSSGGFKVSSGESELLLKSLREDIEVLGISPEDARELLRRVRSIADPRGDSWPVPDGLLDRLVSARPGPVAPNLVSGVAHNWSTRRALAALLAAALEALHLMSEANILKQIGETNEEPDWQLVHDGMGEPLSTWAAEWRLGFRDAVARLTVSRGYGIRISSTNDTPATVNNVNWWGCWVGPARDGISAPIVDVVFDTCDFRGTLFDRCVLRNVTFKGCHLDGTYFRDCHTSTVHFVDCTSDGQGVAFRGGEVADLHFESADKHAAYQHSIIEGLTLVGAVVFTGLDVSLSAFSALKPSKDGRIEFRKRCAFKYCYWDEKAGDLIEPDDADLFNCSPVNRLAPAKAQSQ